MEIFEPFIHNGFVSLKSDFYNATPIKILRDTGSSQSLLLTDTLPFSDDSYSGSNVLIKGVDSVDYSSVPLHNVYLASKLASGLQSWSLELGHVCLLRVLVCFLEMTLLVTR